MLIAPNRIPHGYLTAYIRISDIASDAPHTLSFSIRHLANGPLAARWRPPGEIVPG